MLRIDHGPANTCSNFSPDIEKTVQAVQNGFSERANIPGNKCTKSEKLARESESCAALVVSPVCVCVLLFRKFCFPLRYD